MALKRGSLPLKVSVPASVATVASTAYLTCAQFYTSITHLYGVLPAIAVVGVVSAGGSIRSAYLAGHMVKSHKRDRVIQDALGGLLLTANRTTGADLAHVSASYLAVTGKKEKEALCVARWVGLGGRQASGVTFKSGVGVVGASWQARCAIFSDLRDLNSTLGACTEPEWNASVHQDKQRLSYEDWFRLRNKHQTVITACTNHLDDDGNEGEVNGVVSLTFGEAKDYNPYQQQLLDALIGAARIVTRAS